MRESVGVIIPVGPGHENLVLDAVASCAAQADQTWVVLDGVDIEAPAQRALESFPHVNVLPVQAMGRSAARNFGLAHLSTRWVFPLDADDVLTPWAVGLFLDLLEGAPDAHVIWSSCYQSAGSVLSQSPAIHLYPPWSRRLLELGQCFGVGFFLADRLRRIGGWDRRRDYGEDLDLWLRYALHPDVQVFKSPWPFYHRRTRVSVAGRQAGQLWRAGCAEIAGHVRAGSYDRWRTELMGPGNDSDSPPRSRAASGGAGGAGGAGGGSSSS